MPAPNGYDVGFLAAGVNNGNAAGFFLDQQDDEAFVEEQQLVGDVAVDTTGVISAVAYGLGPLRYRLRLQLQTDVLGRDRRPKKEQPADGRALLLAYAARTSATTLQLANGDRHVLFVEAIKFLSGPGVDGYVAIVTLVDVT